MRRDGRVRVLGSEVEATALQFLRSASVLVCRSPLLGRTKLPGPGWIDPIPLASAVKEVDSGRLVDDGLTEKRAYL